MSDTVPRYSTPTLHEAAGQRGALPAAIKPVGPTMRVWGPAFTVASPPKDNLWLHRAIYRAAPGDVLVVDVSGHFEAGYWGEIMTHAAIARGLGGLVIDGCVRDGALLRELGFPVFARGLSIAGTGKDPAGRGAIGGPLRIGTVTISPGDLVAGDEDGVVVIARSSMADVLDGARARDEKEAGIIRQLAAGRTTLDLFGLDRG